MLSHSSSNAGDRLRRAKSTSSAHTSSSGHQRSLTSIDPFVVRQYAELAAVEAFQRAKQLEEPVEQQAYRPVPPKLQRRRSQATRRTEGSHFEDARLGRRRSTSKKDENREPRATRPQYVPSEAPTSEAGEGEVVITRKRSVIPPSSGPRSSLYEPATVPRSSHRKSQTAHTNGSPVPRNVPTTVVRAPAIEAPAPRSRRKPGLDGNAGLAESDRTAQSPKPSIRETMTDDEILALAREHCLQESPPKKLRERKSFILAPFQRRRTAVVQKCSEHSYDTVLPPFNYADEELPPPPSPPPPLALYSDLPAAAHNVKKSRNFSDSLKGRFRKVFRKATRASAAMPAQHVEATHLHLPVSTPLSTPAVNFEEKKDPFTTAVHNPAHLNVPEFQVSIESRHSSGEQSVAKSRVTSWTNSTVAGTCSTHDDLEQQDTADEQGRLKRSDSALTLKKARSFFGRPVKNRLRRASRLDLPGSDESADLYSALLERIHPSDFASDAAVGDADTESFRPPSALDTLPSRQRVGSTGSSKGGWPATTIRSVTPDPTAYRLDIPSPVAEVLSPDVERLQSRQNVVPNESTPRSQLQRRPAIKASTPSKEQIERRIERSKNRWQSPLDELSPSAPGPSRHTMEENPYELRSLSHALQQPLSNDLPHHARVGGTLDSTRPDVLSPSVYSRGSECESPRPNMPVAPGGMVVTITGREVKSYAISPSKAEHPVERAIHASQEWRRWLSEEMNGWDGSSAPHDSTLPKETLKEDAMPMTIESVSGGKVSSQASNSFGQRHSSGTPTIEGTECKPQNRRPRPSSRLSSYMNDRYPMMDACRNSSDQSVGRRSRISSRADSRPTTAEPNTRTPTVQDRKSSGEGKSLKSALARRRVVTKPNSTTQLASSEKCARVDAIDIAAVVPTHPKPSQEPSTLSAANEDTKAPPPRRPTSASGFQATYTSRANPATTPLEVRRRKPPGPRDRFGPQILDDSTILHISAGPYAAGAAADNDDKENVHPAAEPAAPLPALSSSQWLAAGTGTKGGNAIHPANREGSGSKSSPLRRSGTGTPTEGGSPGQRLATSWLGGKRGRGESSAFV